MGLFVTCCETQNTSLLIPATIASHDVQDLPQGSIEGSPIRNIVELATTIVRVSRVKNVYRILEEMEAGTRRNSDSSPSRDARNLCSMPSAGLDTIGYIWLSIPIIEILRYCLVLGTQCNRVVNSPEYRITPLAMLKCLSEH